VEDNVKTQSMRFAIISFFLVMAIVTPPAARSQVSSGTITGTVTDSSGAAVSGALVTVTQVAQNFSRTLMTNSYGLYEVKFLPVGGYRVTAEHAGFKKSIQQGLDLTVGQVMRVDFALSVGTATETVTVTADATQAVETETSEVGQVINGRQVEDLPLNGRNFTDLIPLNAGVGTGAQGQSNGGFNFNGSRTDQNMFLIDGMDNVDLNNNLLLNPALDSIQEFQVLSGTYSAEYGNSAGGIVTVKLKSGTNQFHGSLFEFVRNDVFDANGFFNNQLPPTSGDKAPRQPLSRNQFGGSLGGPIRKNKLFFFGDYQGYRQTQGGTSILSVPTALEREGNFTETLAPGQILYQNALLGTTYPGCNSQSFTSACQIIPSSFIDPVVAKMMPFYPLPNVPGTFIPGQGTINNYIASGSTTDNYNQFDVKLDYQVSTNDSLSVHYSFFQGREVIPAAFDNGLVGPCVGCTIVDNFLAGSPYVRNQNIGVTELHTFSSNTTNEFRAGLSRTYNDYASSDGGQNIAEQIGMTNVNVSPFTTGLPWFYLSPSPTWMGTSAFTPEILGYTTYQFSDNLSHIAGKHFLKMGFDLRRRLNNQVGNFFNKGEYVFVPLFTGNALGDFLTGRPYEITQDYTPGPIGLREIEYAGYFQDDYKVTRRLTLNLGLRYEVFPGIVEAYNRLSTINVQTATVDLAGLNGTPRQLTNTDYKNLGPRVGFAWALNDKSDLVLRGGYGISYSNFTDSINQAGLNAPYTQAFSLINLGSNLQADYTVSDGLPTQLAVTPENFDPSNPSGAFRQVERNAPMPYTESYSLNVQKALPGNLLLEAGYVGTHGVHLPGELEGDPAPPGDPSTLQQRRIYYSTLPNVTSITLFENIFYSDYNALQLKAQKRLSNGLQFLMTYTFSKSIDDLNGSSLTGGGNNNASSQPQNPFNPGADRAISAFNPKSRFVTSASYELPVGRGRRFGAGWSPVLNGFLGGWQLNGILTLSSGLPFSVLASSAASCGCSVGDLRANIIGNPALPAGQKQGPNGWFNSAAFADPVEAYGDSGRDIIIGPGYANLDASIFKVVPIKERGQLQIRVEYFNVFNRTNFMNPANAQNATWTSGGVLTENFPARIGQFAIKYIF
jgi:Carboxypeptidase regulatory-like domain/TonB-dependent Receptor Plug Domain/TonB dependent receptor